MLVEYSGQTYETRTVYYKGSGTLRKGQPLFYVGLADTAVKLPDGETATSFTPATTLPDRTVRCDFVVNHMASDTTHAAGSFADPGATTGVTDDGIAGIVSDTSVGKVGPCYCDIILPVHGDVLQIEVTNYTAIVGGTSKLVATNATSAFHAFMVKATPVASDGAVFMALQDVAVSTGTPPANDARSVIWARCIRGL